MLTEPCSICVSEATVGGGCKWVAWPLGMSGVLPALVISETVGSKPGLDVFGFFVGVFRYVQGEIGLVAPHQRASVKAISCLCWFVWYLHSN